LPPLLFPRTQQWLVTTTRSAVITATDSPDNPR
jgi:hypothetical protein